MALNRIEHGFIGSDGKNQVQVYEAGDVVKTDKLVMTDRVFAELVRAGAIAAEPGTMPAEEAQA